MGSNFFLSLVRNSVLKGREKMSGMTIDYGTRYEVAYDPKLASIEMCCWWGKSICSGDYL
jgi:hypothetical protein